MDISLYTEYEQPRVAGKHLTRLANNGMAAVTCSNPASRASTFLVEVAGYDLYAAALWQSFRGEGRRPLSRICVKGPKSRDFYPI